MTGKVHDRASCDTDYVLLVSLGYVLKLCDFVWFYQFISVYFLKYVLLQYKILENEKEIK